MPLQLCVSCPTMKLVDVACRMVRELLAREYEKFAGLHLGLFLCKGPLSGDRSEGFFINVGNVQSKLKQRLKTVKNRCQLTLRHIFIIRVAC